MPALHLSSMHFKTKATSAWNEATEIFSDDGLEFKNAHGEANLNLARNLNNATIDVYIRNLVILANTNSTPDQRRTAIAAITAL